MYRPNRKTRNAVPAADILLDFKVLFGKINRRYRVLQRPVNNKSFRKKALTAFAKFSLYLLSTGFAIGKGKLG